MARGGARPGAGRPAGKSANTSPVSARARPRARRLGKSKAVAGRQGRKVVDRSADPVGWTTPALLPASFSPYQYAHRILAAQRPKHPHISTTFHVR
jgi:hypothetical protein